MPNELIETQQINVTISRLPESVISELETGLGLFDDENDLDPGPVHTLQALIVGYDAAWDEIERLLEENKLLETKYHVDMNNYRSQVQTWQQQHDSQIISLSEQLQQTREENKRLNELIGNYKISKEAYKLSWQRRSAEAESLRTELSAKDKVLEQIMELIEDPSPGTMAKIWKQASSILSLSKGDPT